MSDVEKTDIAVVPDTATPDVSAKKVLKVETDGKELLTTLVARARLDPALSAATVVKQFYDSNASELDLSSTVSEIRALASQVQAGKTERMEAMLTAQAHALDAIFAKFAIRSHLNAGEYLDATERYMRMALKAQNQSRMTIETLATIKNPPAIFAKQANITSGPQQVNNGTAQPMPSPARTGDSENEPNKVSEVPDAE